MKKLMLISLAMVIALGGLGVGYAMWSDMLYVKGNVSTGFVDVDFASQIDNDAGTKLDPKEAGHWEFEIVGPVDDDGNPIFPYWVGERYTKNVAETHSTYTSTHPADNDLEQIAAEIDTATIEITNAYPSYWGSVIWDIKNKGSIPMKLNGNPRLLRISEGDATVWPVPPPAVVEAPWADGIELEIGPRYFVDVEALVPTPRIGTAALPGEDFSFILSTHGLNQIDPETLTFPGANYKGYIDIAVHVEQDAEQKTKFDFTIGFQFCNWNEE